MTLAIHTEGLTRDFQQIRAVDHLDLAIEPGTAYGLLGPAGAGKSTTVRMLLGLLAPTAGKAYVMGRDPSVSGDMIRSHSGVVSQTPGLYTKLSAEANLDLFGRIWHLPASERRRRTRELLAHFGLWERSQEAVGRLSRGMQQRVAIARALLPRPLILFLDEPTVNLDPATADMLRCDIAALVKEEGVTVLLTTENLAEVEQICDRLGMMRDGHLVTEGRPDELRQHGLPGLQLEFVGNGFADDIVALIRRRSEVTCVRHEGSRLWVALARNALAAPVINLLVDSGAEVEEVRRHQPTLEMVYRTVLEAAHGYADMA